MSLVTNDPYTFDSAKKKGHHPKTLAQAKDTQERPIYLAVVNGMPSGAAKKAPAQVSIPFSEAAGSRQVVIQNFYVDDVDYGEDEEYVKKHYLPMSELQNFNPDIAFLTGGAQEIFPQMRDAARKIKECDAALRFFSCMGGHAYMKEIYDVDRKKRPEGKLHGVFEHHVTNIKHDITRSLEIIKSPHSRYNDISWEDFQDNGHRILAYSEESGVLLTASADGRDVVCQGHIEYGNATLLRELWRDAVIARHAQIRDQNPNSDALYPEHSKYHLTSQGAAVLDAVIADLQSGRFDDDIKGLASDAETGALKAGFRMPEPYEKQIMQRTPNQHTPYSYRIFANMVNMVFEAADYNRDGPYMNGVDESNPFGMDKSELVFEARLDGAILFDSKGNQIEHRVAADEILYSPLYHEPEL
ncbi:MAG: homoserine O-acetyltransferase/O-succinyltransferase family protein [Alphaproteobacteria bacterium]